MRNAITSHRRRERQSVSARRTAAYERPLDDAVLPRTVLRRASQACRSEPGDGLDVRRARRRVSLLS